MVENVIQIKSGIRINVGARVKIKKTLRVQKRLHFQITELQNPATCSCQNESIIDKSVTMCDKTIEETKTVPTNFKKKSSL